ncbi:MAG: class I tRNA ligase family protein [Candidatus Gracilibacteria bacterium]|nr:class I tRNA ligase family protein [Candidatus Gracilibacteria bacterium]MDD5179255.1 class I tRNA ligase family protein [Candidatus Gracilibacteria bacterium]
MDYNHLEIEPKWQKRWDESQLYRADDADTKREKLYVLDMFPYPSGAGLHVGHPEGYTATDIVSRKARMEGKNVLHPMGWDAFGLPAENHAIKTGIHPDKNTDANIKTFTRQIKALGFSYDWEREITTSKPDYYRFTQWWFLFLYKQGLAYQKEAAVNWCGDCQTVLANEQVIDGKCDRCKNPVIQKKMKQWFFRITDFLEKKGNTSGLLDGLDKIDWPESTKTGQRNWIGKSEGAEIDFNVKGISRGDLNRDFHPSSDSDCGNLFLVTWNTVAENGCEENDSKKKDFAVGEKLIDSKAKAQVILQGLAEAEDAAKDNFRILEAVVAENHLHAVVWINDDAGGIGKVLNQLKGVSARRFFENYPELSNALNSTTVPNPTVNGGVKKAGAIKKDKNNKSQFNHLWRKGYHFSLLANHASYENAMNYIAQHSEKSKVASFYAQLPVALRVFTTRPDTLFGATFMVVAPEHSIIQNLKSEITNWKEVEKYLEEASRKTELARQAEKEKTGVKLEGISAINPVNGKETPIFVADYVLMGYGTGAIMAVPAHDERDFEFAKVMNEKYGKNTIEIKYVVISQTGSYQTPSKKHDFQTYESLEGLRAQILKDPSDEVVRSILTGLIISKRAFENAGISFNSGEFSLLTTEECKKKIIAKLENDGVGKAKITYKMRDWLVSRQRYWGAPIPIIHCEKCGAVPVAEADLPVKLPTDVDFHPTGESPLVISETFHAGVTCPKCGGKARRECDTMDTFVCSSWYYFRYADPKNDKEFASKELLKQWLPVDLYVGGAEHTVLHLLYSRFFTKAAHAAGLIQFDEPFLKLRHQGMILGEDGQKMSKSLGNVINPDEVVKEFGADTLRMYEMFMGPFEGSCPWSTKGVIGLRRFLEKVWRLYEKVSDSTDTKLEKTLHKTIKKVSEDIDSFGFNTAISQMMIFVNEATGEKEFPRAFAEKFLLLLAPFAPHFTEELWEKLGNKDSIHSQPWPKFDAKLTVDSTITLAIQINGKLRDTIEVAADISKEEAIKLAKASPNAAKWLEGNAIKKEIYVTGKLVSFVVGQSSSLIR